MPSPEEESLRSQRIVLLPKAACILQRLLGHLSKGTLNRLLEDRSFYLSLFADLFAQAPPYGSRAAGFDGAPDPDYGLTMLYIDMLRESTFTTTA